MESGLENYINFHLSSIQDHIVGAMIIAVYYEAYSIIFGHNELVNVFTTCKLLFGIGEHEMGANIDQFSRVNAECRVEGCYFLFLSSSSGRWISMAQM